MDVWIFLDTTDRDVNQSFLELGKHSWATKVLLQVWEIGRKLGQSCI